MKRFWTLGLALLAGAAGSLRGQETLGAAAARAQAAWRSGDVAGLFAASESVQVQLPGAEPSAPMSREQAVRLLERHLQGMEEREMVLVAVREVGAGRGYAEFERHYIVSRTRDERCEGVVLGFRRAQAGGSAGWVLTEVRITP